MVVFQLPAMCRSRLVGQSLNNDWILSTFSASWMDTANLVELLDKIRLWHRQEVSVLIISRVKQINKCNKIPEKNWETYNKFPFCGAFPEWQFFLLRNPAQNRPVGEGGCDLWTMNTMGFSGQHAWPTEDHDTQTLFKKLSNGHVGGDVWMNYSHLVDFSTFFLVLRKDCSFRKATKNHGVSEALFIGRLGWFGFDRCGRWPKAVCGKSSKPAALIARNKCLDGRTRSAPLPAFKGLRNVHGRKEFWQHFLCKFTMWKLYIYIYSIEVRLKCIFSYKRQ